MNPLQKALIVLACALLPGADAFAIGPSSSPNSGPCRPPNGPRMPWLPLAIPLTSRQSSGGRPLALSRAGSGCTTTEGRSTPRT